MLNQHVDDEFSAYCHGQLSQTESRRVAEHLMRCEHCRAEYELVRVGIGHLECLALVHAPDELWDAIERDLDGQSESTTPTAEDQAEVATKPVLARRTWWRVAAVAAALAIAAGVGCVWYALRTPPTSWSVRSLTGAPLVESTRIGATGDLSVGECLETDGVSRAEIRVGAIGTVEVEPNSRVRLVDANVSDHRLALDRGTLHARIWSPPRLFFVDTPSGEAIDYGCSYTLAVDDAGSTTLHVTHGWVALARNGAESLVPAGAMCAMRKGLEPGTPYFDDSSEALRTALAAIDFEGGGEAALGTVLAEARRRDSLTLWYLLSKVSAPERPRVYDRLAGYAPPPDGVSREQALGLDPRALEAWRKSLRSTW